MCSISDGMFWYVSVWLVRVDLLQPLTPRSHVGLPAASLRLICSQHWKHLATLAKMMPDVVWLENRAISHELVAGSAGRFLCHSSFFRIYFKATVTQHNKVGVTLNVCVELETDRIYFFLELETGLKVGSHVSSLHWRHENTYLQIQGIVHRRGTSWL